MAKAAKAVPDGFHTITPQLTLDNAVQGIEWYKKALGAEEVYRNVGPDGKVAHAQLKLGNSFFIVNDALEGSKAPKDFGGSPSSLWIYVEDSDALFSRATSAGAPVIVPIDNQFWGDRAGAVADPSGYVWWIATRKEELTETETKQRAEEFFKQAAAGSGSR